MNLPVLIDDILVEIIKDCVVASWASKSLNRMWKTKNIIHFESSDKLNRKTAISTTGTDVANLTNQRDGIEEIMRYHDLNIEVVHYHKDTKYLYINNYNNNAWLIVESIINNLSLSAVVLRMTADFYNKFMGYDGYNIWGNVQRCIKKFKNSKNESVKNQRHMSLGDDARLCVFYFFLGKNTKMKKCIPKLSVSMNIPDLPYDVLGIILVEMPPHLATISKKINKTWRKENVQITNIYPLLDHATVNLDLKKYNLLKIKFEDVLDSTQKLHNILRRIFDNVIEIKNAVKKFFWGNLKIKIYDMSDNYNEIIKNLAPLTLYTERHENNSFVWGSYTMNPVILTLKKCKILQQKVLTGPLMHGDCNI